MLHRRTLHLESLFPRRVSRPATGRPRRKRNDRSNYGDGGACRGCLWECARAFSSLWTRQGVVDGRGRTGSHCFAAFHCLPVNAHTPHRLDIDWRRSRATWLLRRPQPRTYSRLSSFYYMLYRGCVGVRACACVGAGRCDFAGNDERAPSPSQALNLRPWLFVFEATMLARYAFDRQRPRPVAPPDPPDPADALFVFFFGLRFGSWLSLGGAAVCLSFVLSSVLVGGGHVSVGVWKFSRGDDLGFFFFFLRRLIFGKGGLILERMEKVFWYDLMIRKWCYFRDFFCLLIVRYD